MNKMTRKNFIPVNLVGFAESMKINEQNREFAAKGAVRAECIIGIEISLTFPLGLPDRATVVICEIQDGTRVPRRAIVKSANDGRASGLARVGGCWCVPSSGQGFAQFA
ncbi:MULTISPECIES: hypothetical protein [unclassified Mycolicibacterium]|uniref:hypothetical protein n=1 Tax=unclassified Mycolicibacterium TaxID=2636767 RepID=UPI002ED8FC9A